MKNWLFLFFACGFFLTNAQPFEGKLQIDFTEAGGFIHRCEVLVKDSFFLIDVKAGGNGIHHGYLLNTRSREFFCLQKQQGEKAAKLNVDRVFEIYEQNHLKDNFRVNASQNYTADGKNKSVGALKLVHKINSSKTVEVWETTLQVNMLDLNPLLRLAGLWNDVQDGNNFIAEAEILTDNKKAVAHVAITPLKLSLSTFKLPKTTEVIDLGKLMAAKAKSPDYPQLIKAFAGF
ncbi:MAG: hypothetical protein U0T73_05675 [Chitinophagales bacterium]